MIKFALRKWNENKDALEQHIRKDKTLNNCGYEYLVKLVVRYIFNGGCEETWEEYDENNITVVDNGDYHGTQLFIIPKDGYQPCESDYLMTFVGYGSCSGCDTLMAIQDWEEKELTEQQVSDFMTLCRDLVTRTIKPYNCGCGYSEDFDTVQMEVSNDE